MFYYQHLGMKRGIEGKLATSTPNFFAILILNVLTWLALGHFEFYHKSSLETKLVNQTACHAKCGYIAKPQTTCFRITC